MTDMSIERSSFSKNFKFSNLNLRMLTSGDCLIFQRIYSKRTLRKLKKRRPRRNAPYLSPSTKNWKWPKGRFKRSNQHKIITINKQNKRVLTNLASIMRTMTCIGCLCWWTSNKLLGCPKTCVASFKRRFHPKLRSVSTKKRWGGHTNESSLKTSPKLMATMWISTNPTTTMVRLMLSTFSSTSQSVGRRRRGKPWKLPSRVKRKPLRRAWRVPRRSLASRKTYK